MDKTVEPLEIEEAEQAINPVCKIAIGLIETYPENYLDNLVELSKKVGSPEVTGQLFGITERIKLKVACSENDLLSVAFMLLLSQNLEPDDQSDDIASKTKLDA